MLRMLHAVVKSKSRKEYIFERFYESLVQSYQSERSVKFYCGSVVSDAETSVRSCQGSQREDGKGEWIDEFSDSGSEGTLELFEQNIQEIADR